MSQIVLFGAPGAGKGTQAALIKERLGIAHISTGDMFRAAAKTEMGRQALTYMNAGKLVPDPVVIAMVKERLALADCQPGFVLDGFPRTIPQAEMLDELLESMGRSLTCVPSLEVPQDVLVHRLAGRRMCPQCGALYHVDALQGRTTCAKDNAELIQRADDAESAVRIRLVAFENQTLPLKAYYKKRELLVEINGLGDKEAIFERIAAVLKK